MNRLPTILATLVISAPALAQVAFTLSPRDQWVPAQEYSPQSPEGRLLTAQQALVHGEASRAENLANNWLEQNPVSPLKPRALLLKGDSILAQGDEYSALFEYEAICRVYPASDTFVIALAREMDIAKAYAGGLKKKFMGMFRIISGDEEAQELFIRIQERLPGSELAEEAGIALSDFYFEHRDFELAAESYDLFIRNYPRSALVGKARLRLIYSFCATFNGPEHDDSGLKAAHIKLLELAQTDRATAMEIGSDSLIIRLEESEAQKMLIEARWYLSMGDPISAERFIRRLVRKFPRSIATLGALREIPTVFAGLPLATQETCPDYRELRLQLLGLTWDQSGNASPAVAPDPDAVKRGELLPAQRDDHLIIPSSDGAPPPSGEGNPN
ncbi:MAG: outer membrane protein assembly factor BamD [Phycisphaerales bacterium]|nr:outer membrane protein assembly factor BamD [Phycisphaerales bacterium]